MATAAATAQSTLRVTVITPARAVFDEDATAVVVPAFDGELGVLPGHAPLLALLGTGVLRITTADGGTRQLAIRGGFLQVQKNKVTVLTPESISGTDIVAAKVDEELQKIELEKPVKLEERDALDVRRQWARTRKKAVQK